jgi:hypothetical protein
MNEASVPLLDALCADYHVGSLSRADDHGVARLQTIQGGQEIVHASVQAIEHVIGDGKHGSCRAHPNVVEFHVDGTTHEQQRARVCRLAPTPSRSRP